MSTASTNPSAPEELVRRLLLAYLQDSRVTRWPGTDGLNNDDVLNYYPKASENGDVPDRQELCRRHSELGTAIRTFFCLKGWETTSQGES